MSPDIGFATVSFPALRDDGARRAAGAAATAGHAAGYAAGLRAAEAEHARRRAELERAAHAQSAAHEAESAAAAAVLRRCALALEQRVVDEVRTLHAELIAAAVSIAEAVIGRELVEGEASARAALRRALTAADDAEPIAVRLHPDDVRALADAGVTAPVPLVSDAALSRGDAITELPAGWVDARIATALDRVRAALAEESA